MLVFTSNLSERRYLSVDRFIFMRTRSQLFPNYRISLLLKTAEMCSKVSQVMARTNYNSSLSKLSARTSSQVAGVNTVPWTKVKQQDTNCSYQTWQQGRAQVAFVKAVCCLHSVDLNELLPANLCLKCVYNIIMDQAYQNFNAGKYK